MKISHFKNVKNYNPPPKKCYWREKRKKKRKIPEKIKQTIRKQ